MIMTNGGVIALYGFKTHDGRKRKDLPMVATDMAATALGFDWNYEHVRCSSNLQVA